MNHSIAESLHTYIQSLRRYALVLTRDSNEADDLVQECLKRALTYIQNGQQILNMRAYLFTILHNVHQDEINRRRRNGRPVPIDHESVRLAYPPSQDAHMECRDMSKALNKLPHAQRQVVLLIGLEGHSYQTTAKILGIPIGTVMSRLNRGRNALRSVTTATAVTADEPKQRRQTAGWNQRAKVEKAYAG
ncbi:MAG: sigma-70 family RNA polymerase sigma factor [Rhodospirillales bacterium]